MIVTPFLFPSVGGAAIYYRLLLDKLTQCSEIASITVLTEASPARPTREVTHDGKVTILRYFPYRAGVEVSDWSRYLKYAVQNLNFLRIPRVCRAHGITHLLVHSSIHNHLSMMPLMLQHIKRRGTIKLIADVRDPKMPQGRLHELSAYDGIIACSDSVWNMLSHRASLLPGTERIPVIIDVSRPSNHMIRSCLERFSLQGINYVFSANGISNEKGTSTLIQAITVLRAQGFEISLVVAGKKRDWSHWHDRAQEEGTLHYIGPVDQSDVFALSLGAAADVNLSTVEGMPRASLEAMAIGSNVLLPPNVPEFARYCPTLVVESTKPEEIALQIRGIIEDRGPQCYPIASHLPASVIRDYVRFLLSS